MSDVIPATDVVEADGRLVVIVDGPPVWVTEAMEPCGYHARNAASPIPAIGFVCHADCLDGRRVIEIAGHRVVVTDVIDVRNRIEFKTKIARWHELDALPGRFAVLCDKVPT